MHGNVFVHWSFRCVPDFLIQKIMTNVLLRHFGSKCKRPCLVLPITMLAHSPIHQSLVTIFLAALSYFGGISTCQNNCGPVVKCEEPKACPPCEQLVIATTTSIVPHDDPWVADLVRRHRGQGLNRLQGFYLAWCRWRLLAGGRRCIVWRLDPCGTRSGYLRARIRCSSPVPRTIGFQADFNG